MNERGRRVRFIPWSESAASTPQDRLRKCSLAFVVTAQHRFVIRITGGQHDDGQWLESPGQKRHAPGVDRKSLTELLGANCAAGLPPTQYQGADSQQGENCTTYGKVEHPSQAGFMRRHRKANPQREGQQSKVEHGETIQKAWPAILSPYHEHGQHQVRCGHPQIIAHEVAEHAHRCRSRSGDAKGRREREQDREPNPESL